MEGDAKTAGDSEAAGAILGMIETYGTKAGDDDRAFTVAVYDECTPQRGMHYHVTEYVLVGTIPGGMCVVRHLLGQGPYGAPFLLQPTGYRPVHRDRASALVAVRNDLLTRREAITRQIEALKEEIARAVEESTAPAPTSQAEGVA